MIVYCRCKECKVENFIAESMEYTAINGILMNKDEFCIRCIQCGMGTAPIAKKNLPSFIKKKED